MKTLRPTNNSSRNTVLINYKEKLSDNVDRSRKKKLLISIQRKSGRNNQGRITVRHRSGGKGLYRLNDFKRNLKDNSLGTVKSIEYDPFRTAFISYISYGDQKDGYIISPNNLKVGEKIISSSESIPIKIGNNLPLSLIPFGVDIHNIEMNPLQGGKLVRSAGTSAQIIGKDKTERYVIIKLPSKEVRMILSTCRATIGKVSNLEKNLEKLGKAGRSRWRGIRPTVRGSAMNPNSHPHGGGEQKTGTGRHPVTPWGKNIALKTRNRNKKSNRLIITKRVKNNRK